jgi:23S rRNA U2552 (ribose-2'-O)-methylase RlmE/FtsJ
MTYYQLPTTYQNIYKYIDCVKSNKTPQPVISQSLSFYLYEIKHKLEERERDWDIFKKYTNPFEYIHTVVPFKKKCVSKYRPLSRSFFKMIEMINTFQINFDSKPIRTFHLAEGPGGFIEAIAETRKCAHDSYIGMTILDDADPNIPAWKKTEHFLREHRNVSIEAGADGTGNILSTMNFTYCREKYGSTMDFITADGGFDFSMDFNSQEIHISKLLFAQVSYALVLQKYGGTFILKIFDCFMNHTIDILHILTAFYEKVYIMKPRTSRYANSEKYVVCRGFKFADSKLFYSQLLVAFERMMLPPPPGIEEGFIQRFLTIPASYFLVKKIEEYNAIFGQQQIENIHYTISLIENKHKQDKIDTLVKMNIQKCIHWCLKNSVPFHQLGSIQNANAFF